MVGKNNEHNIILEIIKNLLKIFRIMRNYVFQSCPKVPAWSALTVLARKPRLRLFFRSKNHSALKRTIIDRQRYVDRNPSLSSTAERSRESVRHISIEFCDSRTESRIYRIEDLSDGTKI